MEKIGLFYAPLNGSVERIAYKLVNYWKSADFDLRVIDEHTTVADIEPYKKIVFGISTVGRHKWDSRYTQVGWDYFMHKLGNAKFDNTTVAIFGLGDHITYAETFVDAMGELGRVLQKTTARLVGQVDHAQFDEFSNIESHGVINGKYPGLPLDEDYLSHLSDERVIAWIETIKPFFEE